MIPDDLKVLYERIKSMTAMDSRQHVRLANSLNECVESLIDDEEWEEALKVAKTAYVASIRAWRTAAHPFAQISLQNPESLLRKQGKDSASMRARDFMEKKKNEWKPSDDSGHCCNH